MINLVEEPESNHLKDLFGQILLYSEQCIPSSQLEFSPKSQFHKFYPQNPSFFPNPTTTLSLQLHLQIPPQSSSSPQDSISQIISSDQSEKQKQFNNQITQLRYHLLKQKKQRVKSTQCETTLKTDIKPLSSFQSIKIDFISSLNNQYHTDQTCLPAEKKPHKFPKKFHKFILKQKSFGKALKLSFPKKIVQMFINHYDKFPIQNKIIQQYNDQIRTKLKQSKKNDYTFQKQVSQILGQNKQDNKINNQLQDSISFNNRCIFTQIIRKTMKEQVIMRDKIAKNRQLYMIQLKVYALRCRSHKLSKKGTYK